MESICMGIPTLIIEKEKCMNFDVIPYSINKNLYKRVNNYKDLMKFIEYYLNNTKNYKKNNNNYISKDLINYYFEKPTSQNKKKMLNI